MKKTVLNAVHKELNARMVEFAGFEMPVEYAGVTQEHMAVRDACGIFDVSHMGEFIVEGTQALDLLQYITTNDVSKVKTGQAQYNCLPNGKGGIVDDLIIYRLEDDTYMMVVNASNIDKDFEWVSKNNTFGATVANRSGNISLLAVQGPKAIDVLQKLTGTDLASVPSFSFTTGTIAGAENVIISATGYTGAGGFELYCENKDAVNLWNAVLESGREYHIQPVGLAARDTLRLEMGYCLYGNDIDDSTSPLEAGLGWIVKTSKENDFIDKDFILDQKQKGIERKLVGFELQERGIPRKDYTIVNSEGQVLGRVTSGTMSPVLKKGIGMGYVHIDYTKSGQEIYIEIRNKKIKAVVVTLPFIK
jgi:aminomethyltransferase